MYGLCSSTFIHMLGVTNWAKLTNKTNNIGEYLRFHWDDVV